MSKETILTGVRANEEPTLGNYLGAFVPMVQMQKKYAGEYQINMFVPDLHSFTTPIDHSALYANTLKNLKYFIAAGLDTRDENTFIYRQSFIPAHSELTWILDCFTSFGEMSRMTQFKEKSAEHSSNVSVGLFNYPVLMAADIAIRMNNKFGELFTVPDSTAKQTEFIKRDKGLRIRSLTNPHKKMSKSSDDQKSKINLNDTPEQARKKIMSATTDSLGAINFDWENQPGITNLLQLLAILTDRSQEEVNAEWIGQTQYGPLKKAVAEAVASFLSNFQARLNAITDDDLLKVLERSERAMTIVANETLLRVQKAVGLRR